MYRAQTDTALLSQVVRRGGYATGQRVLDIGSGTGALALQAWRAGAASVTAVDVSRRSVAATWLNTRLRGANVAVHRGDLFGPIEQQQFGLIIANLPYVPSRTATLPRHRRARCWDAGLDGRAFLDRVCGEAATRLTGDGLVLLVHSAVCGTERTLARLAGQGLEGTVLARASIPFGPVMRARTAMLQDRGFVEPGQSAEELVVVGAWRGC